MSLRPISPEGSLAQIHPRSHEDPLIPAGIAPSSRSSMRNSEGRRVQRRFVRPHERSTWSSGVAFFKKTKGTFCRLLQRSSRPSKKQVQVRGSVAKLWISGRLSAPSALYLSRDQWILHAALMFVPIRARQREGGAKLRLTGQPFEVLTILLERPGEVVTREELEKRLCPDTFVDVERQVQYRYSQNSRRPGGPR